MRFELCRDPEKRRPVWLGLALGYYRAQIQGVNWVDRSIPFPVEVIKITSQLLQYRIDPDYTYNFFCICDKHQAESGRRLVFEGRRQDFIVKEFGLPVFLGACDNMYEMEIGFSTLVAGYRR